MVSHSCFFRACALDGGRVGGAARPLSLTHDHFLTTCEAPIAFRIGVIDTGIVVRDGKPHTWLDGHVEFNRFSDEDSLPGSTSELAGHGTFVAGRILQEARNASVRMIGVLDKSTGLAEDVAVAAAIDTLAREGVTLINLSFSGDSYETGVPGVIQDALDGLAADVVVVAAAGNSGQTRRFYPAALKPKHARMIAVGAVDETEYTRNAVPLIADFSNHGAWVDVYSSGVDVLGPVGHDQWARWSGTSFAAASVTGAIARMAIAEPHRSLPDVAEAVIKAGTPITAWDGNGSHASHYLEASEHPKPE